MMQSLSHFLAMGGYGFFVWSAYGLSALVLGLNVLFAIRREHYLLAELARRADYADREVAGRNTP